MEILDRRYQLINYFADTTWNSESDTYRFLLATHRDVTSCDSSFKSIDTRVFTIQFNTKYEVFQYYKCRNTRVVRLLIHINYFADTHLVIQILTDS